MSEATDELSQRVQQLVPQFLFFRCDACKRFRKFTNLRLELITHEERGRIGTVIGTCGKCGKESRESIHTEEERVNLANRTTRYYQREQRKQQKQQELRELKTKKKEKKPTMALKVKKNTKKSSAAKAKAPATKKSTVKASAKKSESTTERGSHWDRKEGQPNGTQTLALIFAGGPWTIEEAQKRHDQLAKKGAIARRLKPIGTIDGTWLTKRPNGVNYNGKKHEAYRGVNADGEDVFTVPSIPDPLASGSKALRVSEKGDKLFIGKTQIVKDVKELKGASEKKAPAAKKSAKK